MKMSFRNNSLTKKLLESETFVVPKAALSVPSVAG